MKKYFLEMIFGEEGQEVMVLKGNGSLLPYKVTVYPLTEKSLRVIPVSIKTGNYRLGYVRDGIFHVRYIGRSTSDEQGLIRRLYNHVKDHERGLYPDETHFQFMMTRLPICAYIQECQDFHVFGGENVLRNSIHPAKLKNLSNLRCPVCHQ